MTYYDIRQEGHKEAWQSFSYSGEEPADRNASMHDALARAMEAAQAQSRQRGRPWTVEHVSGTERRLMARFPGTEREREAEEERPRSVAACDIKPGMIVWNPYGGSRGRLVAASEVRERPDGTVEFDAADGRTGHFRPQFRLRPDWPAMDRAKTEEERELGA
jgi:hypothetical protein